MKRIVSIFLILCLMLAGCQQQTDNTAPADGASVELIYYTIGTPDADLAAVNAALNELLLARYGFSVAYHKIDWNHYTEQFNAIANTKL